MTDTAASVVQAGQERRALPRSKHEISLGEHEFEELRRLIREMTGISLDKTKRLLVFRRLSGRLKALRMTTFSEYLDLLATGDLRENELFCNALTTNKTAFFRESHHFDFLSKTLVPDLVSKKGKGNRRLRIWSAACSSGEEAYSIAMTIMEGMPDLASWDAKILGTDIDSAVIAKADLGIYPITATDQISQSLRKRFFRKGKGASDTIARVSGELQKITTFKQLNLIRSWPMKGEFDAVFCRNVFIYFEKSMQEKLIERFADVIPVGGYLILGHSETLGSANKRFELVGKTVYRKVC